MGSLSQEDGQHPGVAVDMPARDFAAGEEADQRHVTERVSHDGQLRRRCAEVRAAAAGTADVDSARDAAHGVARPAAPLTTFLVGYAAATASSGKSPEAAAEAVAEASRKATALALRWQEETEAGGGPGTP